MDRWLDGWMDIWIGGWVDGLVGFGRMELAGSSSPSTRTVSSPLTDEMISRINIYQTEGTGVDLN